MVSYPILFFSPVSLLNWKRLKVQEISNSPLYYHFHLIFLCALKNSINIGNNIPERYMVHIWYSRIVFIFPEQFLFPTRLFSYVTSKYSSPIADSFLPTMASGSCCLLFTKVTHHVQIIFDLCFVTFQSPIISATFVQIQRNLQHKISLPRNVICTLGTKVIRETFAHRVVLQKLRKDLNMLSNSGYLYRQVISCLRLNLGGIDIIKITVFFLQCSV